MIKQERGGRRGQALVETALLSVLVLLLTFGMLVWIPVHRARSAATAAAYACAQFLAETPDPDWAAWEASQVAWKTLDADWSATLGTTYDLEVLPPTGAGSSGTCVVFYRPWTPFNDLLHLDEASWSQAWFVSRSETWKARWR
jgi:hypothetical protein